MVRTNGRIRARPGRVRMGRVADMSSAGRASSPGRRLGGSCVPRRGTRLKFSSWGSPLPARRKAALAVWRGRWSRQQFGFLAVSMLRRERAVPAIGATRVGAAVLSGFVACSFSSAQRHWRRRAHDGAASFIHGSDMRASSVRMYGAAAPGGRN